jgi:DNA-binding transcriptional LysR family regulator
MSVARYGSFRAASGELNVAQSAVSRQIQSLEYEHGMPLFERRPRGVALTDAGRLLFRFCQHATFDADRMLSEFDALRGLQRGQVHIAAIESMVPAVLPKAIERFRSEYPGITFSIDILTTDPIVEAIRNADADIGIIFNQTLSEDLIVNYCNREALLAAMSPSHPLAALESIDIHDLAKWPVVLAHPKAGSRLVFDEACQLANINIAPFLETNSLELMHRIVLHGNAVTLLLRHTITESLQNSHLTAVQLNGGRMTGTLKVITLKDRKLPIAAEKFLTTLCEDLDALPMPSGHR